MSRKAKKVRDVVIIVAGLIPCFMAFLFMPPQLYVMGLVGLIVLNVVLLGFLIPSAIALQEDQDRTQTVICIVHQADQ
ncbi:MAG: hypothetical protein QHH07_10990 [Sedimentisphaerales bacterium]|nr:hypothetical protein [Sedimentisphaerales bacterium]